jgi:flavin reductase (DIM6/NTAB) family NADH-FMN oxidoreductase RutF
MISVPDSEFRNAMARFLTGVTVVTTRLGNDPYGMTANSFTSVSLEPPTVLVCLNRKAATCSAVSTARVFCVNVLREDQGDIAKHFGSGLADKFASIPGSFSGGIAYDALGCPNIGSVLATISCRVMKQLDAGSHRIFLGNVVHVAVDDGAPLAYFRSRISGFAAA